MKKFLLVTLGVTMLLVGIFALALPTILHKPGQHPKYTGENVQLPANNRALSQSGGPL